MVEKPVMGKTYEYRPVRGPAKKVVAKGWRKGYIETDGMDGQHRSISPKQLFEVE